MNINAEVTFWGKKDLRDVLKLALEKLDAHYADKGSAVIESVFNGMKLEVKTDG